MFDILQLNDMLVPELKDLAEKIGLKGYKKLNKQELIYKILDQQALALESNKENGKNRILSYLTQTKQENAPDPVNLLPPKEKNDYQTKDKIF